MEGFMKKVLPTTLVIASCALAVGLAAGSLAIANYAPDAEIDPALVEEANSAINYGPELADLPTPVVGDDLFFAQNTGSACMNRDQVINVLLGDQAEFGGQTLEIAPGRDQAFADAWRDQTGEAKVKVSGVVGHMFKDVEGWTVDVVEFNGSGCAMSRTLLPAPTWTALIDHDPSSLVARRRTALSCSGRRQTDGTVNE
jgi:hypothetical protein